MSSTALTSRVNDILAKYKRDSGAPGKVTVTRAPVDKEYAFDFDSDGEPVTRRKPLSSAPMPLSKPLAAAVKPVKPVRSKPPQLDEWELAMAAEFGGEDTETNSAPIRQALSVPKSHTRAISAPAFKKLTKRGRVDVTEEEVEFSEDEEPVAVKPVSKAKTLQPSTRLAAAAVSEEISYSDDDFEETKPSTQPNAAVAVMAKPVVSQPSVAPKPVAAPMAVTITKPTPAPALTPAPAPVVAAAEDEIEIEEEYEDDTVTEAMQSKTDATKRAADDDENYDDDFESAKPTPRTSIIQTAPLLVSVIPAALPAISKQATFIAPASLPVASEPVINRATALAPAVAPVAAAAPVTSVAQALIPIPALAPAPAVVKPVAPVAATSPAAVTAPAVTPAPPAPVSIAAPAPEAAAAPVPPATRSYSVGAGVVSDSDFEATESVPEPASSSTRKSHHHVCCHSVQSTQTEYFIEPLVPGPMMASMPYYSGGPMLPGLYGSMLPPMPTPLMPAMTQYGLSPMMAFSNPFNPYISPMLMPMMGMPHSQSQQPPLFGSYQQPQPFTALTASTSTPMLFGMPSYSTPPRPSQPFRPSPPSLSSSFASTHSSSATLSRFGNDWRSLSSPYSAPSLSEANSTFRAQLASLLHDLSSYRASLDTARA